jgi:hypothetical protein
MPFTLHQPTGAAREDGSCLSTPVRALPRATGANGFRRFLFSAAPMRRRRWKRAKKIRDNSRARQCASVSGYRATYFDFFSIFRINAATSAHTCWHAARSLAGNFNKALLSRMPARSVSCCHSGDVRRCRVAEMYPGGKRAICSGARQSAPSEQDSRGNRTQRQRRSVVSDRFVASLGVLQLSAQCKVQPEIAGKTPLRRRQERHPVSAMSPQERS